MPQLTCHQFQFQFVLPCQRGSQFANAETASPLRGFSHGEKDQGGFKQKWRVLGKHRDEMNLKTRSVINHHLEKLDLNGVNRSAGIKGKQSRLEKKIMCIWSTKSFFFNQSRAKHVQTRELTRKNMGLMSKRRCNKQQVPCHTVYISLSILASGKHNFHLLAACLYTTEI